jgi:hypothetical protein
MLEMAAMRGWRGSLGITMILTGLIGTLVMSLSALRRRLVRR